MVKSIRHFLADESGATAVEYGILLSGLVVAIIGAIAALGGETDNIFSYIASAASGVLRT